MKTKVIDCKTKSKRKCMHNLISCFIRRILERILADAFLPPLIEHLDACEALCKQRLCR